MKQSVLVLGLAATLGIGAGLAGGSISYAQTSDPRVSDLVQAGSIRVGLGLGSPALAIKDQATGEVRGVALDLARALAAKIGVELRPVYYLRPSLVLEEARTNAWDITFLVADPARALEVDFSPPYLQSDFTYLVPVSSSLQKVAEADRPGVRIAVPRGDGSDLRLSRLLKQAELVRADSISAAIGLVRTGDANAYGGPRFALLAEAARQPGVRVLDENFAIIYMAAAVPKGESGRLAYVSEFLEEAKASGVLKETIERGALRGVQIAPAAGKGAP
jgi:polar amino acid transport system substrate-binding protein